MLVKTINIWGAMTTGDDKLIVEEVETQSHDPPQTFYTVKELSYEMQETYTYQTLPPILDRFIRLCYALVKPHEDKLILYGPHLAKQTPSIPIYQYPKDYFTTPYELTLIKEDAKMKKLLLWLEKVLELSTSATEHTLPDLFPSP
jgi:hypothetical protein